MNPEWDWAIIAILGAAMYRLDKEKEGTWMLLATGFTIGFVISVFVR